MARRTAVYLIWCPDLWPGPCYVGTAVRPRKRFERHLKDARQGKSKGGADCVRAIWAAGCQPKLKAWKWFDTEREAKKAEARFKELVKSNPRLDLTNRHAGLETGVDSEARARGGRKMNAHPAMHEARRKGAAATHALKDADGKSVNARKGGRKGAVATNALKDADGKSVNARKGAVAMLALKDADGKSVNARKGGRVSKGGRHTGALYGRDDLVRYIRTQDPGTGQRAPRSRELAAEIEREHGIRVHPKTICRIWRGTRYQHVK